MKPMIQSQNDYIQSQKDSFNRLESSMSQLNNAYKEEETLSCQCFNNTHCPNHIDRNQESWCLGDFNQDSISSHHIELDQSRTLDKLASFHFMKIDLDCECEPDLQSCD